MTYNTYMETRTDTFVKYLGTPSSGECVVLDMDDTLCTYDKSLRLPKCEEFQPRPAQLAVAYDCRRQGIDVVVATARPCWTSQQTWQWLRDYDIPARALYVRNRKNCDMAPHDLKREMLLDIQKTWKILSFHDDSPWNCAVARSLGINAVFVPGNEEYWEAKGESMGWAVPA